MKIITRDDIADMGLNSVDKLVELGLIPDDTDTDNENEFQAQDAIREVIEEKLIALGFTIMGDIEWKNFEYGVAIETLVGKEPVRMKKDEIMGLDAIEVDGIFYWYDSVEDRDADYRIGSSMVVQYIDNILN